MTDRELERLWDETTSSLIDFLKVREKDFKVTCDPENKKIIRIECLREGCCMGDFASEINSRVNLLREALNGCPTATLGQETNNPDKICPIAVLLIRLSTDIGLGPEEGTKGLAENRVWVYNPW